MLIHRRQRKNIGFTILIKVRMKENKFCEQNSLEMTRKYQIVIVLSNQPLANRDSLVFEDINKENI
jgi:hypothetical protein